MITLGPTRIVLLYDPTTGKVRHTHYQMTLAGTPAPEERLLEDDARKAASKYHEDHARLLALHSNALESRTAYRVDLQKRIPVAIPRSARGGFKAK